MSATTEIVLYPVKESKLLLIRLYPYVLPSCFLLLTTQVYLAVLVNREGKILQFA